MATSSTSKMTEAAGSVPSPTPTQLLFARSVIYTFDLWPALRLAISEQWGGNESKAKADFLISYLCDEYSQETTSSEGASVGGSSSSSSSNVSAPQVPDVDDLAEILEGYFADEFESRLEDESADLIAARLVQFHKIIYATFPPTKESLATASIEVDKLEQHAIAVRGKKVVAQTDTQGSDGSSDDDDGGSESGEEDSMELDNPAPKPKAEPVVDEDGFTTVVKGKRR